jgi:hypothetical protein
MRRSPAFAAAADPYGGAQPDPAYAVGNALTLFESEGEWGQLHHIRVHQRHAGTQILVLAHDRHIRVLTKHGELLPELVLDRTRDYQPAAPT